MKKAVFKLELHDDEAWKKAIKKVSALSGLDSIFIDMKEKKLTVIGDIDPVCIVGKLRKLCHVEIIAVGPAKESEKKNVEPKKEESKKKDQDPVAAPFIDRWGRFFFSDIISAADARATDQGKGEKMDHSNVDSFWNHVVKMDDGSMKCKFCGCPFAKGTSILRIKWHLSGERGLGVTICTGQVPKDVQEVAFLAVPGNKRQKTLAISSNVNDNAISSCPQVENNEVDNLARDVGRIQMAAVQDTEQGVGEGRTSSRAEAGNLMEKMAGEMMHIDRSITAEELIVDAHENRGEGTSSSGGRPCNKNEIKEDALPTSKLVGQASKGYKHKIFDWVVNKVVSSIGIIGMGRLGKTTWVKHENRGEALQAPDLLGQALGSSGNEMHTFLMKDDVENSTGRVVQPGAGTSSSGGLPRNTNEIKGDGLPITRLVGQAFEDHKKMIGSWLMNDEVSSIGIYGMGGVGKTTLVKHIYNQLLERPDNHVYWITVSQVFSINKLQSSIARLIGLDLSNEEEEMNRAVKLSKELMKLQNCVLILDDLWNSFKLHKVGIPVPMKGCKLIVTTRSVNVCQGMNSQKEIEVKPLSQEEAWTLFMEKFGCDVSLFGDVKKIAQLIAEECDGLPLVIVTMAGTMKGVDDIHEWSNALEYLKQSRVRQDDMEPKVSQILRFSYTHLKDSSLQQCFLYCSLFPEDFEVDRDDLIGYLIDEGVIKETKGRSAEFDKGHGMLNELLNVSLLERGRNSGHESVKMHDLIRDMALQIQQENSQVMVKSGIQLKELPDAEEWAKNLVRVSLMENQIEEIPSRHSPRCPSLSTLLLCNNELQFIANSFFKEMHRLKVLDMSHTNIEILPDFVSNLVSLNALLLKSCEKLRHIPSLQKLTTLKRLDLNKSTALESMPQGMECLSNLKYLRLNGCGEKEFPSGILPKLLNLQVLVLENNMPRGYAPLTVKGDEVACLTKLETLECYFEGYSDFMEYLKLREKTQSLSRYQIFVGQLDKFCRNKSVGLGNLSVNRDGDFQVIFPNDIEELVINNCNDARSLCDVSPLIKYPTELEVIRIWYCNSMESLVSSSWFCSAPLPLPSSNGIFSSLREFYCYKCTSMKKLFPLILLPNLVNLERISVVHCEKMEEIIATRDEEGVICEESSSCYSNIEANLPKLRILELRYLPELKSICSAKLICNSLEEIEVWDCEKLERISVALPLLDNGQPSPPPYLRRISVYPNKWWETVVEWEHPNTKEILSQFLSFD